MGAATELREGAETIALGQPPHDTLAQALVAALAELTVVEKGRTAKIPTKDGKSYSYDFADIADVVKLTRPVLKKHGLVALTPVHDHPTGLACTVKIIHTSGESLDLGPFPFPRGGDAQATGSAVTYHRRYALVAALGMAAGDDDDGAAAGRPAPVVEPAFEWTEKAVKADLLNILDGDQEKAKRVWSDLGQQVSVHGWGSGVAAALLEDWMNQNPLEFPTTEETEEQAAS